MGVQFREYRNEYYITHNKTEFYRLMPDIRDEDIKGSRYFIRAFRYIEDHSDIAGKTFVVVEMGTEQLPVYGENVIVIVVSDSFQMIPAFAGRVGMIFKCLGNAPAVNLRPSFSYLYFLMVLRYLRSLVQHHRSRRIARRQADRPFCPIHAIPLGDRDLADLPVVSINTRRHDVSFLGSVNTNKGRRLSVTGLLGTPKTYSRRKMFDVLRRYRQDRPERDIALTATAFSGGGDDSTMIFSKLLSDTKVCLVPRGDVPETYRFYQGLRYGCAMIIEQLPDEWFFTGAPAILLRDWEELPTMLDTLLADEAALERMSQQSLQWWKDITSYEALGRYMMSKIA